MIAQIASINRHATRRQSSNSCWPLRCADGRTFAERAAQARSDAASDATSPTPNGVSIRPTADEAGMGKGRA